MFHKRLLFLVSAMSQTPAQMAAMAAAAAIQQRNNLNAQVRGRAMCLARCAWRGV